MALGWYSTVENDPMGWTCGYCGREVGGNVGYRRDLNEAEDKIIYICPSCQRPTVFLTDRGVLEQVPAPAYGHEVESLPDAVAKLYAEVRRCVQYNAPTAAVLCMRKLLMNVAVEQGAEPNGSFLSYIDYLGDHGWIPPNGRGWVDAIRKTGNEATHEIALMDGATATRLLDFTEMLLRLVYEFPAKLE